MAINVRHEYEAVKIPKKAWFTGTTALLKGQGVCYDVDRGTDTDVDERRMRHVTLPSQDNHRMFAGVASVAYPTSTAGREIIIFEPGSTCDVALTVDVVVGKTTVTCSCGVADAGLFGQPGFAGRGTALALQTNASGQLTGEIDGTGSLVASSLTLTGTGFDDASEGDNIFILAGQSDGTNTIAPLATTIATVTNDSTVVLAAVTGAAGTAVCSYAVTSATSPPTCLAYLQTGEESGLVEWISSTDNVAVPITETGHTFLHGGGTQDTGDSVHTLTTYSPLGSRKSIKLIGALTTHDFLLTVAGIRKDGSTSLASLEFDADGDTATLTRIIDGWGVDFANSTTEG